MKAPVPLELTVREVREVVTEIPVTAGATVIV